MASTGQCSASCRAPRSPEVSGLVDDFVRWLRPALRTGGDLEFVEQQLARLREHGAWWRRIRQRAVFDENAKCAYC
ncbi:MAG TPA: hypothetical protein VGM75_22595 [Pseudonocardiaceae bacterium]